MMLSLVVRSAILCAAALAVYQLVTGRFLRTATADAGRPPVDSGGQRAVLNGGVDGPSYDLRDACSNCAQYCDERPDRSFDDNAPFVEAPRGGCYAHCKQDALIGDDFDGFAWPAEFTIAMWVQFGFRVTSSGGDPAYLVSQWNTDCTATHAAGTGSMAIMMLPSGVSAFYNTEQCAWSAWGGDGTSGDACNIVASVPTDDSAWRHLAFTFTATGSSGRGIFFDGALSPGASGGPVGPIIAGNFPIRFGPMRYDPPNVQASIADLRIYETLLTAADIAALADTNQQVPWSLNLQLIAQYDFASSFANTVQSLCTLPLNITAISPSTTTTTRTASTTFTIQGSSFQASGMAVTVGTASATTHVVNETHMTATLARSVTLACGTADVQVSWKSCTVTHVNAVTAVAPTLESVQPTFASMQGAVLSVKGTCFASAAADPPRCRFSNVGANSTSVTTFGLLHPSTELVTCPSPTGAAAAHVGDGQLTLAVSTSGFLFTTGLPFSLYGPVSVNTVAPTAVVDAGGELLRVSGGGFVESAGPALTCTVECVGNTAQNVSVHVLSESLLTCRVPQCAPGVAHISVSKQPYGSSRLAFHVVPGAVSPGNVQAHGEGLCTTDRAPCTAGVTSSISLELRDALGYAVDPRYPGGSIAASCTIKADVGSDGSASCDADVTVSTISPQSVVTITHSFKRPETVLLSVTFNGTNVAGSPFELRVAQAAPGGLPPVKINWRWTVAGAAAWIFISAGAYMCDRRSKSRAARPRRNHWAVARTLFGMSHVASDWTFAYGTLTESTSAAARTWVYAFAGFWILGVVVNCAAVLALVNAAHESEAFRAWRAKYTATPLFICALSTLKLPAFNLLSSNVCGWAAIAAPVTHALRQRAQRWAAYASLVEDVPHLVCSVAVASLDGSWVQLRVAACLFFSIVSLLSGIVRVALACMDVKHGIRRDASEQALVTPPSS